MAPILKKFVMARSGTPSFTVLVGVNRQPSSLVPGVQPLVPIHQRWIPGAKLLHPDGSEIDTGSDVIVQIAPYFFGYRIGATLEWIDVTTIRVHAGDVFFNNGIRSNPAFTDIDLSVAGDRELGVGETANTWYYIYAEILNDDNWKPFFSTTQPTLEGSGRHPTNNWVYLGAVRNDAGSDLLNFYQTGNRFSLSPLSLSFSGTGGFAIQLVGFIAPPYTLCEIHTWVYTANNTASASNLLYFYHAPSQGLAFFSGHYIHPAAQGDGSTDRGYAKLNGSSQCYAQGVVGAGGTWFRNAYQVGWIDPFLP